MSSDEEDRAPFRPPLSPDSTKRQSQGPPPPPPSTETAISRAGEPASTDAPSTSDSAMLTQEEIFHLLRCIEKP